MLTRFKNQPGNFSYTLQPLQADFQGRFSVVHLCDVILESAMLHAASLGFGFDDMRRGQSAWVLTRMAMRMEEDAFVHDEISVETWVDSVKSSFSTRKFNVFKNGRLVGGATSVWMLIDVATRRPKPIDAELFKNVAEGGRECVAPMPEKVEAIAYTGDVFKRRASYCDIDVQNHVHSGKYLEWILDTFSKEHFAEKRLREVHLNFLAEAVFGDEISMQVSPFKNDDFVAVITAADGRSICHARLGWE
jgi:acyl-ACP thioesterase